jgi:8-oxo-dGTP pyrophosphatase MutT (NUDIX family)
MTIDEIASRVAAYRSTRIADPNVARAAVALVLASRGRTIELLLIERAMRDGDPWSGHMALPGGRRAPDDRDIVATAVRETREEVGIDLGVAGTPVGALDELRAIARHRPVDLVISPLVFVMREPVTLVLDRREVASAVWVPLAFFSDPAARGVYRRSLDGIDSEFPAFCYREYTVWGLTHRILEQFLAIAGASTPPYEQGKRALPESASR